MPKTRVTTWKKLARFLKNVYKELDAEAMKMGVSPDSSDYLDVQTKLRDEALSRWGYSLEEYQKIKDELSQKHEPKEKESE